MSSFYVSQPQTTEDEVKKAIQKSLPQCNCNGECNCARQELRKRYKQDYRNELLNSLMPSPNDNNNGRYIFSIFHSMMTIVAVYLSFRCNKRFDAVSFIFALCCPYFYIIYTLATSGTCGLME